MGVSYRSIPFQDYQIVQIGSTSFMVATIQLFVTVGKGTLARWNPTQRVVVQGVYRHVPNPMISGVFFVLIGEALLAASLLLGWFVFFVAVNVVCIPLVEEPGLVKRFGERFWQQGHWRMSENSWRNGRQQCSNTHAHTVC
jgi:protein-S-isoprenylcysteine O-methyltransferase Ste14